MEFSKEQMQKAYNCKTLEEFKELAKAEGLNFTDEEAERYFTATHHGELSDNELTAVTGGKGKPTVIDHGMCSARCPFCNKICDVRIIETRYPGARFSKFHGDPKCCGAVIIDRILNRRARPYVFRKGDEIRLEKDYRQ